MFKKGAKVYSILRGWGEVISEADRVSPSYPIRVGFGGGECPVFTTDGKFRETDKYPELYHTEPVITVPKRRVEHTGWIQISNYEDCDKRQCSAFIFDSKELLDKSYDDKGTYIKQQITYYTEE